MLGIVLSALHLRPHLILTATQRTLCCSDPHLLNHVTGVHWVTSPAWSSSVSGEGRFPPKEPGPTVTLSGGPRASAGTQLWNGNPASAESPGETWGPAWRPATHFQANPVASYSYCHSDVTEKFPSFTVGSSRGPSVCVHWSSQPGSPASLSRMKCPCWKTRWRSWNSCC